MNTTENNRNISTLDYFNILQFEYILYELRSKIYPYIKDREKFKNIMDFKKYKINDISKKNSLTSIFVDVNKRESFEKDFIERFIKDEIGTKKDKYFYYFLGSDFSYLGKDCKIKKYNLNESIADIEIDGEIQTVGFCDIKRIL